MSEQKSVNTPAGTQVEVNRLIHIIGIKEIELTLYRDKVAELTAQLASVLNEINEHQK